MLARALFGMDSEYLWKLTLSKNISKMNKKTLVETDLC